MALFMRFMTLLVASYLFIDGQAGMAQQYQPQDGDEVVVYIKPFRADTFDQAKRIMVEEFGEAMSTSGQERHTY